MFFPCNISFWLGYQGNFGLSKLVSKCSLLFIFENLRSVTVSVSSLKMLGRIHQWSHQVQGFFLNYWFNLPTSFKSVLTFCFYGFNLTRFCFCRNLSLSSTLSSLLVYNFHRVHIKLFYFYRISKNASIFISGFINLVSLFFFLFLPAKRCLNFVDLFKEITLDFIDFSLLTLYLLFVSVLIFIISFLLMDLNLVHSYCSSSLFLKLDCWFKFSFTIDIYSYTFYHYQYFMSYKFWYVVCIFVCKYFAILYDFFLDLLFFWEGIVQFPYFFFKLSFVYWFLTSSHCS